MSILKRTLLLSFALILAACDMTGLGSTPIAAAPLPTSTASAPPYQVPIDATATATPFQPLPPTAVYIPTEIPTATPLPPPEIAQESVPIQPLELPKDQVNILLLGSDARPGARIFRTDTIILASLNPSKGTVSLLSFPRDLYIHIPGWGDDRINTAWVRGGYPKLVATLEHNFGIRPDYYVLINFSSFKRVIDSLGGLEVQVDTPLTDYYRGRQITIHRGTTHMNADQILWYVRSRKTTNDFARNKRQQEILQAVAMKLLSMDAVRRFPEFYAIYKDTVQTDMGLMDILPLLPLAAQMTDTSRIKNYFVGSGQVSGWITPGGAMVLLPNRDKVMNTVRKTLSGQ